MNLLNIFERYPGVLDEVFINIQVGVLATDLDGRIQAANSVAENLLGYEAGELEAKELSIAFTPEDMGVMYPNLLYLAGKKRPYEGEVMLRRKDGLNFMAYMTMEPRADRENSNYIIAVTIQDINQQKVMEKVILDGQSQVLNDASSGLSEEVKHPLAMISRSLKKLVAVTKGHRETGQNFMHIIRSVKRIEVMISKFERLVSLPNPNLNRGNIREVIDEAAQINRQECREKNIVLSNEAEDGMMYLDQRLIGLALKILMEIYMKSLGDGGRIAFESEKRDNVYYLFMRVDGKDITLDDLALSLGQPAKENVTGLGLDLATIKRIMEKHQGNADYKSIPGTSTTHVLSFPLEKRRYIRTWRFDEE